MKVKHKKAFSMVTAIFVMFIMASLTALIMNVTGKTVKATTHQYQKEQAMLLARSYTELAILYTLYYDRNSTSSCLEKITGNFGNDYNITINIRYIGNDILLNGCKKTILTDGTIGEANNTNDVATWTTTGGFYNTVSLIIDTYVNYKDFDDPSDRNITFHRRTIQKL